MATLATRPPDAAKYVRLANEALARLLRHLPEKDKERTGGFFCLTDEEGQPRLVFQVGEVPVNKLAQYWRNANEKPHRTSLRQGTSSRDSRDENRERWIGSLWADGPNIYGSFSGLPENFDEILVADVLVRAGDASVEEVLDALVRNEDFVRLRRHFDWAS